MGKQERLPHGGNRWAQVTTKVTPFSLGIDGENWEASLPGLYVPVGGAGVVVIMEKGGVAVVSQAQWVFFDDLLMATAFIHDIINERKKL